MTTSTYHVSGMTCGHCVGSVTSELSTLEGVRHVEVDLATGRVQVDSDTTLDRVQVAAAVEEAGYSLQA